MFEKYGLVDRCRVATLAGKAGKDGKAGKAGKAGKRWKKVEKGWFLRNQLEKLEKYILYIYFTTQAGKAGFF